MSGWAAPVVKHRGARLLDSGNMLTDFLTRWAAGTWLPKPNLSNAYSMLTPRRPSSYAIPQQVTQGPPTGLLARLAYMNPGMSPMLGAAGQTLTDPRFSQQLSPEVSQLLRYL